MPRAFSVLRATCLSAFAGMPAFPVRGFTLDTGRNDPSPAEFEIPHRKGGWKWRFTFIPAGDTTGPRDSDELRPE